MNNCLSEVRVWMLHNKLQLNDSKTECIIFASKHNISLLNDLDISVAVGTETIIPVVSVRTLGADLDREMTMSSHISSVTRSAYYHLRQIGKIQHHLDSDTCKKVVHSTVTSRLDYHNALLTNATAKDLHRLQLVQNNAARVVTGNRKYDHIQPVLFQLHWLPIRERITFKLLSFVHQSIHSSTAPEYLRDLFSVYQPKRTLRSSNDQWILSVKRTRCQYGAQSFPVHGAKLWNMLPKDLRSNDCAKTFRKHLKTYLFKK
jgi:hypothetical protein